MSTSADGRPGVAAELRRRRTALGWTLEQVAEQAQVSVGMLSLIETGQAAPLAALLATDIEEPPGRAGLRAGPQRPAVVLTVIGE